MLERRLSFDDYHVANIILMRFLAVLVTATSDLSRNSGTLYLHYYSLA